MSVDGKARAARRFIEHIGTLLQCDLYVRLWNGEVIPLGTAPRGPVGIAIMRPNAISSLVRWPRLSTLLDLLIHGDLEIEGGTLLDLQARRGALRTRDLFRRIDRGLAVRCLAPFLFGAGAARPTAAYAGAARAGRDDAAFIRFHYDDSNAFYALFLDSEMQYSSAYFERPGASLDEGQIAKLDLVCRKLNLSPGERFLDVGCGWGGLLCHAAGKYGVIAHGISLSESQVQFTRAKIERLGLVGRASVALGDYTSVDGVYDKIASIELAEHLGIANYDRYFTKINALLAPRGVYIHQASARRAKKSERRFARRHAEYDALTRYVFPGGELDYIGMTLRNLESHGLEVHDVLALREHMAQTIRCWAERLYGARQQANAEVGEVRTRTWLLYLAGAALTFERGGAVVFQTLASKRARGSSTVARTRAGFYPR